MLTPKEHKKMYKSGKNWVVVTLSTAALALGASVVNANADATTPATSSADVPVTESVNSSSAVMSSSSTPINLTLHRPQRLPSQVLITFNRPTHQRRQPR